MKTVTWRNFMKYLKISMAIIFIFLVISPVTYGADTTRDNEINMLRQKVVELENRIKEMEATLAKYQEKDKALDESGDGWENLKNWRRLKTGMNTDEVLVILGTPIKTIDGVKTLWYYPDRYRGYVSFDDKGRLTGWHEP